MSERKVLNKYYPPDYDPSKIPRIKGERSKQFCIRVMAPFNMRCDSCGEYIYKGKKFNSRMENVEGESYLGIPIRRFYIKCPRCVSEITFRTDPESVDYAPEHGSTRLFEALRTAEKMAAAEEQRKLDEEADNPMKQLEKRTTASQREIEMLETLEELKELNARHASLDHEQLLDVNVNAVAEKIDAKLLAAIEEEEDERIVREAFGSKSSGKRTHESSESDDDDNDDPETTKERLAAIAAWKKAKPSGSTEFAVPAKPATGSIAQKAALVVRRRPEVELVKKATSNSVATKPSSSAPQQPRGLALQYSSSDDSD